MATEANWTFSAGDRVVLESTGECGVIVHTWVAEDIGGIEDCYVAFFGSDFPKRGSAPAELPYILRYAATSLRPAPP